MATADPLTRGRNAFRWVALGRELLEDAHQDCVERGYLLLPLALQRVFAGDAAGGYGMFCQAR